jgi:hypothetical protein
MLPETGMVFWLPEAERELAEVDGHVARRRDVEGGGRIEPAQSR